MFTDRLAPAPWALLLLVATAGSGCASLASSAASGMAENLSASMLNQDDPELVREATPAYLLLLDSLVEGSPDDPAILGAAAQLYAVYGSLFVEDAERAKRLTARSREYGSRALCAADSSACDLDGLDFDSYSQAINGTGENAGDALYAYAVGLLASIRARGDMAAIAELPKAEVALSRVLVIGGEANAGSVNMYLGVLNTLRPPALGGDPEKGRAYFEEALQITARKDLSVQVEYARGYARLVYDRELHDRLLTEVLEADPEQPSLTLFNLLAQDQAAYLMASADEYF